MSLSFKDLLGQVVTLPGLMDLHTHQPLLLTVVDIPVARELDDANSYEYRRNGHDGATLSTMITNDMTRVVCAYMSNDGIIHYVEARLGALRGQPTPVSTKSSLSDQA